MVADEAFFNYCLVFFFLIPLPTVISLCLKTSPYGRHQRPGTGHTIPAPLAWFLFESPTLWLTILLFPFGKHHSSPKAIIHMSFYLIHYFHRTVIYPIVLHLKNPSRKTPNGFPVTTVLEGFVFNLLNAYLQVRTVTQYAVYDDDNWFGWRFLIGLVIYVTGMAININSDYALQNLKSQAKGGYKIPRGGMFEVVSCPNYFGEIIEWFGWALITWSWAGFGFFLQTFANLVPRGIAHHKWYFDKFGEDYPKTRKAVIPFVC